MLSVNAFPCLEVSSGSTISPFSLLLVADAYSYPLDKGIRGGLLIGYQIGSDHVEVSHLEYADDTILFLGADCYGLWILRKLFIVLTGSLG